MQNPVGLCQHGPDNPRVHWASAQCSVVDVPVEVAVVVAVIDGDTDTVEDAVTEIVVVAVEDTVEESVWLALELKELLTVDGAVLDADEVTVVIAVILAEDVGVIEAVELPVRDSVELCVDGAVSDGVDDTVVVGVDVAVLVNSLHGTDGQGQRAVPFCNGKQKPVGSCIQGPNVAPKHLLQGLGWASDGG